MGSLQPLSPALEDGEDGQNGTHHFAYPVVQVEAELGKVHGVAPELGRRDMVQKANMHATQTSSQSGSV